MNDRLLNLTGQLSAHHLDAYLVTEDTNIRYLTRFPASESWLLVGHGNAVYLTDFRYVLEARKGLKNIPVFQYSTSLPEAVFARARLRRARRIGFDERHVSLATFRRLKAACPASVRLVAANGLVEKLREIKEKGEIEQVRQALKIQQQALRYLKGIIRPGVSEAAVCSSLEQYVKARRVGFSFDPIIASGPNSSLPHAKPTARRFGRNEIVLVDFGIDVKGYKSDLTRIFILGKIPQLVREIFTAVEVAQRKAIAKIKAGVKASEVDFEARNYLKSKKLSQFFGHSLGHGVGLQIHEDPRLSSKSPAVLKENMIVTVEPAVYLPNKFGIRIEDMVLVNKAGCEVLSEHIDHGC